VPEVSDGRLAVADVGAELGDLLVGELSRRAGGLRRVQRRREIPTRVTQWLQIAIQRGVVRRVLRSGGGTLRVPLPLRLIARFPRRRRIPARMIGLGVRPEHVRTPAA